MSHRNEDNTPAYLNTPPTSKIDPPIETRKQELPFGKLKWEDFERLCYRLARLEAEVEHCQPYGVPGQRQEGIDIYAKLKMDDKYVVYQCKRENNFEPSKIRSAVSKFLEGKWVDKAKVFVLCTKESLKPTDRAEEIELQRQRLNEKGILLESWDCIQLSTKLKDQPKIVDDFFGRSWVEAFLGKEEADKLGDRLDNQQVTSFRESCVRFYKYVFRTHDSGLPIAEPNESISIPLEDRYIIPDINDEKYIKSQFLSRGIRDQSICENREELINIKEVYTDKKEVIISKMHKRQPIEEWLINSQNSIVIGGPGSGKSTLLRFLAIDLLCESPRMTLLSEYWGQYLPVWVPFALWTKMISEPSTNSCSLTDLLHNWLRSYNEERLSPLIKQALEDERLLLLVDGLDEYTNEQAAAIAFGRLQVFIRRRNVPAIITSRPNGFKRLSGIKDSNWQLGRLSNFSIEQQRALSKLWLIQKIKSQKTIDDETQIEKIADIETEKFIDELQKTRDLRDLAKIPLLLCLLIFHKIHNTHLPQNRFIAYDSLINYIICDHPQRRKAAASVTGSLCDLSENDIKKVLARLAYAMHESYLGGAIDKEIAITIIEDYLRDPDKSFGFNQHESSKLSSELLNIGENDIGIIVKKSSTEIGFFHRVFQEYLTSQYISYLPFDEQIAIIEHHCTDPQWTDVILGLLFITNRIDDVKKYIESIENKSKSFNKIEQYTTELLLAEVAFGDYNCPTVLARRLAKEIFSQVELGSWMPHREILLHHILDGLRSTKVKELVKSKLREWFPCRTYSREYLLNAMVNWPTCDDRILEYIWRGLRDERIECQRSAARVLAKIKNNDNSIGDKIELLARESSDPITRLSAIEALLSGWPGHSGLPNLLRLARTSSIPELRLIAIIGNIQYNRQNENDLNELLKLSLNESHRFTNFYEWDADIIKALISGWPQLKKVKNVFLNNLSKKRHILETHDSVAVRVLLKGYPQDEDIARFFAERIRRDKLILSFWNRHDHPLDLLAKNFKDNGIIVSAIDEWIQEQSISSDIEIASASLIGCTEISKAKLLNALNESHFLHWPANALIEGWGMQDPMVSERLNQLAFGPASNASLIAHLIPRIIEDKTICRNRLMEILRDPSCQRPDFVLEGLKDLDVIHLKDDIINHVLYTILASEKIRDYARDYTIFEIFSMFPSDDRIKEFAKKELLQDNANYSAIAWTLGSYEEIRSKIFEVTCPLSVNLRKIIAERIEEEGDDEFAFSLLQIYNQEVNEEVKTQASISYHRRLSLSGLDISKALDNLSKGIKYHGLGFESQRASAFCGLAMLNRLDILADCKEPNELERPCIIHLRDYAPNIPLIKTILHEWKNLKLALGPELLARFSSWHKEDLISVWDSLCILADEYPFPREDALEFLEKHNEKFASANILNFISRCSPESKLLLEYCKGSFYVNQYELKLSMSDEFSAAKLLGSQFRSNKEIRFDIESKLAALRDSISRILSYDIDYWLLSIPSPNYILPVDLINARKYELEQKEIGYYSKFILALCAGWPESPELDYLYEYILKNNPPIAYEPYFYLISLKGTSDLIYKELIRTIGRIDSEYVGPLYYIIPPILRRLRSDNVLIEKLIDRLKKTATPSEKVIIPKIISDAKGLSPELKELRDWCFKELEKQFNEFNSIEIGIDLASGKPKAVSNALLEILSQSNESEYELKDIID